MIFSERHVKADNTGINSNCSSNAVAKCKMRTQSMHEKREVEKMGLATMLVRGAVITAAGGLLYGAALNPIMDRISSNKAVVEQGYANPKLLSIQAKKNSNSNIEAYLNYKNGEETVALPCKKGPSGPLCGTVDYWWNSIGAEERAKLVVSGFEEVPGYEQRTILEGKLKAALDALYSTEEAQQQKQ